VSKITLTLSVDDAYLDRFPEVVEDAAAAGLHIDRQLDAIGIVTGSIDSQQLAALRSVAGVARVEPVRQFQIAPPWQRVQ